MTDLLVVGPPWQFDAGERIWGTGGWLSPEEREALDWLTLARLLGWNVRASIALDGARPDVCLVACEPAHDDKDGELLLEWARAGSLIVAPLDRAPLALRRGLGVGDRRRGHAVRRSDGSSQRHSESPVEHTPLEPEGSWQVWATIDDRPAVVLQRIGPGRIALLGFHPSAARDASRAMTDLLVHLLTREAPTPTAWLDLSDVMVLRMDDPGGAQNVYSKAWSYPKLAGEQWRQIDAVLARRWGRMSLAYSSGFVDDGDPERGRLYVSGSLTDRSAGTIHPAPLVRYEDVNGHSPGAVYDYEDEYRGISSLVNAGRGGVEIHGYTHLHPDLAEWARAPDRYENIAWFRELGPAGAQALALQDELAHPLVLGYKAIEQWFGRSPTTLVCPGEEWTNEALEVALDLGLSLIGSYYLAVRHDGRFCWTTHVCSPYLDEPAAGWFDSPLPVVGYMHDRDLAIHGVEWLAQHLEMWENVGARRFIDYGQLAALIQSPATVTRTPHAWAVSIAEGDLPPPTDVHVYLRTGETSESEVTLFVGGKQTPANFSGSEPMHIRSGLS